jgi:hypothetical protein
MEKLSLQDLIATCTDGLDVVTGDDDFFNIFRVMNGFKQEALTLSKEPINLDSNHQFLKLIQVTTINIIQTVRRAGIADDEPRVELAEATLTHVNNILQKQRKLLEAARDAKSRETAPAAQPDAPAEEKATPKTPVSWRERFNKWINGEEQPSHARIGELLSRMQELNSQSV